MAYNIETPWSELKAFVDARTLSIQWLDISNNYYLAAFDGPFTVICRIAKVDSPAEGTPQYEFEASYKAAGNKKLIPDTDAYQRTDQFAFAGVGFTATAAKSGNASNLDYKVTAERYINGIQILCSNQAAGDKATFQIIDKDNVLGYGANVVLQEFATDWQIADTNQDQGIIQLPFRGKIPANCYVRIKYTAVYNVLGGNVTVAANLLLHRKTV